MRSFWLFGNFNFSMELEKVMAVDLDKLFQSLSLDDLKKAKKLLVGRDNELKADAVASIKKQYENYIAEGIEFTASDFSFLNKGGKLPKAKTSKTATDPNAPAMFIRKFKGKVYPVIRGSIDPVFAGMSKEDLDNLKEPNPEYKKYMDEKNKAGK